MNNFDQSSTGTNIEFSVTCDSYMGSIYYNDFISEHNVILLGKRETDYLLVGDTQAKHYTPTTLKKLSKKTLVDILDSYYDGNSFDNYLKQELINELKDVTHGQHFTYLYHDCSWHDLICTFTSRGYSQGDAVKVLLINDDLLMDDAVSRAHINHILWDSPVRIQLTVDDHEFDTWYLMDDEYDYDSDEIKTKLKLLDIPEYAKTWLLDNVPDSPEYID